MQEGKKFRDKAFELDDPDEVVLEAAFKCLWTKCRAVANQDASGMVIAGTFPPLPPAIQGVEKVDKAPKKLGRGDWKRFIDIFEGRYTPRRPFPQKMVAGAEEVLARLIWDNEISKVYTPLGLGEVLATRAYDDDAAGNVNKTCPEE